MRYGIGGAAAGLANALLGRLTPHFGEGAVEGEV